MLDLSNKTAIVTGASSGLGAAYAQALADRGAKVILIARRADRLRELSDKINLKHGLYASSVLSFDLSSRDAGKTLAKIIKGRGTQIDILVNNAGFGRSISFGDEAITDITDELSVNVLSLVDLTREFLPDMQARGQGVVINVASTAAFQSLPFMAVYGATKAFVLSFTEALWGESIGTGVNVIAVCPGPTATEFFDADKASPAFGKFMQSADQVIRATFKELDKKKPAPFVISGRLNHVIALSGRFSTRRSAVKLAAAVMRRSIKKA